ncbi:MAG: dTDP-4-dehydrorhamnose reductase [Eubacteriales bacterium]|nr:dTDP-4-dehydrorhamnose reductase [Eubacteriales bacterium]MDD3882370.1 dTDP-4-dehydrorhamnose reductase [Eubacteriales bacterium]MDD4512409.1 dTDP-4-dehydrorhamnose reductase [Eubacteriales bacterium]
MKVLVTGAAGQLGHDVMLLLKARGADAVGADKSDFDITDSDSVNRFVLHKGFDAIVHAAAWTNVDLAETEKESCRNVNVVGTRNIAKAAAESGAKLAFISTDYVFSGAGTMSHETDEAIMPINYYGFTKAEGEKIVRELAPRSFIIRSSWIFGINGGNFVKTMLKLAKDKTEISVVCDQIGSPTYSLDLARLITDMLLTEKYGTYHASNEGFCSWAEFASEIFAEAGVSAKVKPVSTGEYPAKAKRPLNSRLSKKSLDDAGFERLPDWKNALGRYLEELRLCD